MDLEKDLKKLKLKNLPVSIYSDRYDTEAFCFGYIAGIDEYFVYINHISPYGDEDGLTVRRLNSIHRMEYDGDYERRLSRLYRLKGQSHRSYSGGPETMGALFKAAKEERLIVTVALGDEEYSQDYTGFVDRTEGGRIYLRQLSYDSMEAGMMVFFMEDVFMMNIGSQYENAIRLLYEDNKARSIEAADTP